MTRQNHQCSGPVCWRFFKQSRSRDPLRRLSATYHCLPLFLRCLGTRCPGGCAGTTPNHCRVRSWNAEAALHTPLSLRGSHERRRPCPARAEISAGSYQPSVIGALTSVSIEPNADPFLRAFIGENLGLSASFGRAYVSLTGQAYPGGRAQTAAWCE